MVLTIDIIDGCGLNGKFNSIVNACQGKSSAVLTVHFIASRNHFSAYKTEYFSYKLSEKI